MNTVIVSLIHNENSMPIMLYYMVYIVIKHNMHAMFNDIFYGYLNPSNNALPN